MLADDFEKLYILIDKIVLEGNIKDTIQHINVLDSVNLLRKEFDRALFIKENP